MDLECAICEMGRSPRCAGAQVLTVGCRVDSQGRIVTEPCPHCGGKTKLASDEDRAHYRERLIAEARIEREKEAP